jgi:hypothetical protein
MVHGSLPLPFFQLTGWIPSLKLFLLMCKEEKEVVGGEGFRRDGFRISRLDGN